VNMPMAEGIKPGYGLPTIANPDNPSKAFIRQRKPVTEWSDQRETNSLL